MKFGKVGAIAVAMAMFTTSYQPAQAFGTKPAPIASQAAAGDVIEVGHRGRRGHRRGYNRGYHRGYNQGYHRAKRRSRHRRGRYIAGGLIAGALIGSVLAAPRYRERRRYRSYDSPRYRVEAQPRYRVYDEPRYRTRVRTRARAGGAHVNWCYNRYRSYREYDNTFQPYDGRRRECYSPYN